LPLAVTTIFQFDFETVLTVVFFQTFFLQNHKL
jgi:hypothetical protein